jgi:hypothetical protein
VRLLKLVNTLPDFARIGAGRVTAAYERIFVFKPSEAIERRFIRDKVIDKSSDLR